MQTPRKVAGKTRRLDNSSPSDPADSSEHQQVSRYEAEELSSAFTDISLQSATATSPASREIGFATASPTLQHSSVSPRPSQYIIAPGGPLFAHWDNSIHSSNAGTFFEPQGELTNQLLDPYSRQHEDFATPFVIRGYSPARSHASGTLTAERLDPVKLEREPSAESDLLAIEMSSNTRAGMKRKAASEAASIRARSSEARPSSAKRISTRDEDPAQPDIQRRSSRQSAAGMTEPSPAPADEPTSGEMAEQTESVGKPSIEIQTGQSTSRPEEAVERLYPVLPVGKVFPVRIGATLFHLSGGSISSDGESHACACASLLTLSSAFILFAVLCRAAAA
jgi:hypothetical protein